MKMRFGKDKGNLGALIRWGKYLDNGIWIRTWKFRKLWFKPNFRKNYLNFGFFVIQYGN